MDTKRFGEKIAYGRQNQKMTQEELALRLAVTPQALSKWERGVSLPDVSMLSDICRILQLDADELLQTMQEHITENGDAKQTKEVLDSLEISEPLVLLIGTELIEMIQEGLQTDLIHQKRMELAKEGILLPIIRIRDSVALCAKGIRILSYDKLLYEEMLEQIDKDTFSYIVNKLVEIVGDRSNYAYILNREMVKTIVEQTARVYPVLVEETVPRRISYGYLLRVLRVLLQQGMSIRNLNKLIEIIDEKMDENLLPEEMAEVVIQNIK